LLINGGLEMFNQTSRSGHADWSAARKPAKNRMSPWYQSVITSNR